VFEEFEVKQVHNLANHKEYPHNRVCWFIHVQGKATLIISLYQLFKSSKPGFFESHSSKGTRKQNLQPVLVASLIRCQWPKEFKHSLIPFLIPFHSLFHNKEFLCNIELNSSHVNTSTTRLHIISSDKFR